jgi:hypothetical protein
MIATQTDAPPASPAPPKPPRPAYGFEVVSAPGVGFEVIKGRKLSAGTALSRADYRPCSPRQRENSSRVAGSGG